MCGLVSLRLLNLLCLPFLSVIKHLFVMQNKLLRVTLGWGLGHLVTSLGVVVLDLLETKPLCNLKLFDLLSFKCNVSQGLV